ncbi:MAG: DUF885 domain-containing protein [Taibaiella sp.]|nr:DUF885 domain-containing protein [Taibaiella sp.]
MKKLCLALAFAATLSACKDSGNAAGSGKVANGSELATLLDGYWQERMQLFPFEATANGDNRYNDKFTIPIAASFRDSLGRFYKKYLDAITKIDTTGLGRQDVISYRLFTYEMKENIEGLKFPSHLIPISQFWSFTLDLPQLGSGTGNQPFKTAKDYDDWLKRVSGFPSWVDTAIGNMRQGIATGWVLPRSLVVKILPQLKSVVVKNDTSSIFYGPVKNFPSGFADADKQRLVSLYANAIDSIINPSYTKLALFFENEYLPKSRATSGISAMLGGAEYYKYCIHNWTTTTLSADSIYRIGELEVARIEGEMNKVREATGFKGNLQALFKYVEKDSRFCPFTTPKQVLDSFWAIKKLEDPQLSTMFSRVPKTPFTIRQTEAFRAASASAEYNQGSEDGTRPGIFYVPILDVTKFNATGMATLFLHEAIPGHHYQISLQQENKGLPAFRRFSWYGAYGEGWAHYCETLGKGLGLYDDPYQYLGHLGDAMHRAIRLVVDIGMHAKGMTREEAIKYMMAHELISERDATAEIERYMAIPGQALSYKIGQMAISGERKQYEQQLGAKFNLASFHEEVLKDGCLPLDILKEKMSKWAGK